jgi:hypothetical protein
MEDASLFSQRHDPPEDLNLPQDTFEDIEVENLNTYLHKSLRKMTVKKNPPLSIMLGTLEQNTVNLHLFMLPSKSMISFSIIVFLTQIPLETL